MKLKVCALLFLTLSCLHSINLKLKPKFFQKMWQKHLEMSNARLIFHFVTQRHSLSISFFLCEILQVVLQLSVYNLILHSVRKLKRTGPTDGLPSFYFYFGGIVCTRLHCCSTFNCCTNTCLPELGYLQQDTSPYNGLKSLKWV